MVLDNYKYSLDVRNLSEILQYTDMLRADKHKSFITNLLIVV